MDECYELQPPYTQRRGKRLGPPWDEEEDSEDELVAKIEEKEEEKKEKEEEKQEKEEEKKEKPGTSGTAVAKVILEFGSNLFLRSHLVPKCRGWTRFC